MRSLLPCLLCCLAACGGDAAPSDAGRDAAPPDPVDAGAELEDATPAPTDGGASTLDAGGGVRPVPDAGPARPDAGGPPQGAPTLVAIGRFGRITTSCDGGRTWAFDRSDDDGATCEGIDCDHHRGASMGLTWGGGWFWAAFGWGEPAMRVRRSADGVAWDTTYDSAELHFAGLAWADDRLVGATTIPHASRDGASWDAAAFPEWDVPEGEWPVGRQVGFAPTLGGRVAVVAGAGDRSWGAVVVSRDGARTFASASLDEGCRGVSRPPVFGGGAWVLPWSETGVVCVSLDGGDTWTARSLEEGARFSNAVYADGAHVMYAGSRRWRSRDGLAWRDREADAAIEVVGYDPFHESWVATTGAYDTQRFLRSSDGLRWETLPEGAYARSHAITHVTFGWGDATGACAP